LRTIREFAEQEVIIPDGPFRGFQFSCRRQPHTRLWFGEIDSGRWRRHVLTGPVQSGKSLIGFVIPAMYHLFEHRETVILGLPSMEIAADKWREDLEPAIRASRYRDLIPNTGAGSRGGNFESIKFRNGATLKFMSGGGSDKKRSAFTSRVLIVTETDGLDEAGEQSREADPLRQLEARTASYGEKARIYLECTVSFAEGRTWQEIQKGTQSRIALRCPHCLHWVTPERENLIGHQGAANEVEASRRSQFYCPDCGTGWSEADRRTAHDEAKLVHRTQEIDAEGVISGELPPTWTLGYRYSAVNNFFRSQHDIGATEWAADRATNEEAAEREQCQFVWAIPPKSNTEAVVSLDARVIAERMVQPGRGFVHSDAQCVTVGVDIGKYQIHWTACDWRPGARGHVIDYGVEPLPTDQLGQDLATLQGLRDLREVFNAGWDAGNSQRVQPLYVFIDSGYLTEVVYSFVRESQGPYLPCKGQGAEQRGGSYLRPRAMTDNLMFVGDGMHIVWQPAKEIRLVELDSDHWKTWLHERWRSPLQANGSLTLWKDSNPRLHYAFGRHQVAEEKQTEYKPGKGEITKWVRKNRQNHWLDTTALACAAAFLAGVRLDASPVIPTSEPQTEEPQFPLFEQLHDRMRDWQS